MAESAGKWVCIIPGYYKRVNAAGKTLAYAERYRSFWNVTILPLADAARAFELSESPKTLREAKGLAERAYLSSSKACLKEDAAALARLKSQTA